MKLTYDININISNNNKKNEINKRNNIIYILL